MFIFASLHKAVLKRYCKLTAIQTFSVGTNAVIVSLYISIGLFADLFYSFFKGLFLRATALFLIFERGYGYNHNSVCSCISGI